MTRDNAQSLRILAITRAYGERAGGMERLSFELIEALKSLPNTKLKVLAHATASNESLFKVRIRSILFALLIIPRALWLARSVDVIHLGDPVLSIVGWIVKHVTKKPVAVTVHGLDVSYEHILYAWYLRAFFRDFALYLPISKHAEELLRRWSVKGKYTVINPGINDRWYEATIHRDQLNALLGRNVENQIVLFTSGRLVKRKGHAWFIASVLKRLGSNVLYVIAGSGAEAQAIMKVVRENHLENKVVQLGKVQQEALKVLYNTADAFIQPNIKVEGDAEGFGIVLLEAASCALPVFASNIEGIPQAITSGENGTLLPSEDSDAWVETLLAFISSPERSPRAREYTLRRFNWKTIAGLYFDALAGIVQR